MGNNLYDSLVHGLRPKLYPLFEFWIIGDVLYLVCVCAILWFTLMAIRDNKAKEHRLKLFPLLIHATLAGVNLLYLGYLIAFHLKFILADIIGT